MQDPEHEQFVQRLTERYGKRGAAFIQALFTTGILALVGLLVAAVLAVLGLTGTLFLLLCIVLFVVYRQNMEF